jgi:FAD/FMN-containing dehydrogenase
MRCGNLRESIPLAQSEEGPNIKHDIALPVSAVARFVAATDAALERAFPGVRLVNFGHLGDGNLHYNVQAGPDADSARFPRGARACGQHHRLRRRHGLGRLDFGGARHRRAQARRARAAQVAGRARADALDQAGARPAGAC